MRHHGCSDLNCPTKCSNDAIGRVRKNAVASPHCVFFRSRGCDIGETEVSALAYSLTLVAPFSRGYIEFMRYID